MEAAENFGSFSGKAAAAEEIIENFGKLRGRGAAAGQGIAFDHPGDAAGVEIGCILPPVIGDGVQETGTVGQGVVNAVVEQVFDVIFHQQSEKIPVGCNIGTVSAAQVREACVAGIRLFFRRIAVLFLQGKGDDVFTGGKERIKRLP